MSRYNRRKQLKQQQEGQFFKNVVFEEITASISRMRPRSNQRLFKDKARDFVGGLVFGNQGDNLGKIEGSLREMDAAALERLKQTFRRVCHENERYREGVVLCGMKRYKHLFPDIRMTHRKRCHDGQAKPKRDRQRPRPRQVATLRPTG